MTQNNIKEHFEQNMLDGDEVQGGQMLSSEFVLEYIQEYFLLKDEILKARPAELPTQSEINTADIRMYSSTGIMLEQNKGFNKALKDWSKALGIGDEK